MDHGDVEREGPVCQREFRVQKSDDKGQVRSDILLLLLIQYISTRFNMCAIYFKF